MKTRFAGWLGWAGAIVALQQGTAFAQQWGELPKLKNFVGLEKPVTNLREMEALGLTSAELPIEKRPWSDTFWPDMYGSIANPYAESHIERPVSYAMYALSGFNAKAIWNTQRSFLKDRSPIYANLVAGSQEQLDNLSPAEKYDLLMGDLNFTLTKNVVHMVDVLASDGVDLVATFSGVCHGWGPASLQLPRPQHSFKLFAPAIGRTITFYPADVKALASFLWGKSPAQVSTRVEGWQCQSGAKKTKYGRLTDPRCFDVNPSFFHLVMVNQVGVKKEGFIMEREYKAAVQNQPAWKYAYKYYKISDRHPNPGMSFREARLPVRSIKWDPYRHYRNPKTKAVVGVEATVTYTYERDPAHEAFDSPAKDENRQYTIRYDLELDDNDEIIGGEWRQYDDPAAPTLAEQIGYKHPDLVWLVPTGLQAWSGADADIPASEAWNGAGPAPQSWRAAAIKAANNTENQRIKGRDFTIPKPQPLGKVVNFLLELSRK